MGKLQPVSRPRFHKSRKTILAASVSAMALLCLPAAIQAASQNIPFIAIVNKDDNNNGGGDGGGPGDGGGGLGFCQIQLLANGTIASSLDFTQLSSKQPGGSAGVVQITKSGTVSLNITADAPTTFSAMPINGDNGVSFATSYSAVGATTSPEVAGNVPTPLNNGVSILNMHLAANRSGSLFPSGSYTAEATVRCE